MCYAEHHDLSVTLQDQYSTYYVEQHDLSVTKSSILLRYAQQHNVSVTF